MNRRIKKKIGNRYGFKNYKRYKLFKYFCKQAEETLDRIMHDSNWHFLVCDDAETITDEIVKEMLKNGENKY
jgi:hypothetical protein